MNSEAEATLSMKLTVIIVRHSTSLNLNGEPQLLVDKWSAHSTTFLFWATLFSTQLSVSNLPSWIHMTTIILRHQILYLVYLCTCLGLDQFMSYLCDLFFVLSLIFIVINHITSSLKQAYLIFVHFLECLPLFLDNNVNEESE